MKRKANIQPVIKIFIQISIYKNKNIKVSLSVSATATEKAILKIFLCIRANEYRVQQPKWLPLTDFSSISSPSRRM